jgi:hypothetical protein
MMSKKTVPNFSIGAMHPIFENFPERTISKRLIKLNIVSMWCTCGSEKRQLILLLIKNSTTFGDSISHENSF